MFLIILSFVFMADFTFTDDNFEAEVLKAKGLVLVDFFAVWCGPCKMMAPVIDKLAQAYEGKIKVGKLDGDENMKTSEIYGIQSIPTLIFFKDGQPVYTFNGFQSEEVMKNKFEELLK